MERGKYETHVLPNLENILTWARAGATYKDIAAKLNISYTSLRKYIDQGLGGDERYAALSGAFEAARLVSDEAIETALFQRARGMEYTEVKAGESINRSTGEREVLTTRTTKFVPPDPTSAIFWLTNRRPERWSHRPTPPTGEDGGETGVVILTPVEAVAGEPPQGGGADG